MLHMRMLSVVGCLAGAATIALALFWLLQRRMIYFPSPQDVLPAASALERAEDVTFETADELRLHGWFASPAQTNGATVLIFNGNAGDRSSRAPLAAALTQAGFSVLLFDYRGYGGNPGDPSEQGLLADARAARQYVGTRGDVDPSRQVYFGESLGAAVALALAVEQRPAALVLRSPFTSLTDMARLQFPFLPYGLLLRDRFESLARIGQLQSPLLVIAGDRDGLVPPDQSRRLYEAAPEPKRFVLIAGADHNDAELLDGQQLITAVTQFLDQVLTPSWRLRMSLQFPSAVAD
jgi:fermentation-respiration switch protein FrsA (DUF1100 family)